ncbi:uncharacterized protein PSFLO_02741 [Pseudozyma flocculosa]|uniref:Uncharacterized protein n=1 Tax=Pseudozyma flocculosa TaxID=84751 RepID=A0A5C3F1E0_9BASI|nr:uncharacterized protein PSFLO_02741 [Pseudozyma flocculosa]
MGRPVLFALLLSLACLQPLSFLTDRHHQPPLALVRSSLLVLIAAAVVVGPSATTTTTITTTTTATAARNIAPATTTTTTTTTRPRDPPPRHRYLPPRRRRCHCLAALPLISPLVHRKIDGHSTPQPSPASPSFPHCRSRLAVNTSSPPAPQHHSLLSPDRAPPLTTLPHSGRPRGCQCDGPRSDKLNP